MWENKLKEVIGYSDLFDFYDVGENIGKGKYGLVKRATHKESK